MKFSTKAIHEGNEPEKTTGAVTPPIFLTSTFAQESPAHHKGYDYTRAGNPNFTIAERQLAALEHGKYATVYSSGLGALTAYVSTLQKGDRVVALDGLYGGTFRLFNKVFSKFDVGLDLVSSNELPNLEKYFDDKTKLFLLETPTNPLLEVHDIADLSGKARKHGVKTLVDNTFASPYLQNPLNLGADIVWHSCTKYLGGHSDIIGGAMVTNDKEIHDALLFARMAIGVNPSPFDVWLLSRSLKTLAVRMERHSENAAHIYKFLSDNPAVKKVYFPAKSPVAALQMRGFGGMISAEFNLSLEETIEMISHFRYFTLAESLGGVESLVNHPASMTHASIPKDVREKMGISDGLVRFSVGIEDIEDLLADLRESLRIAKD